MKLGAIINRLRHADKFWQRYRHPDERGLLVDARNPLGYDMIAPLHRFLQSDLRLRFFFMASRDPANVRKIYREAPENIRTIHPRQAALMRFDAYVVADFLWPTLFRGTPRIQMFHGVAGKFATVYDRPDRSMRDWNRLFFINRKRLQNYIDAGAIDKDSASARLIGMPKVDCLVDGSLTRDAELNSLGLDPAKKIILYAPTWTPYSSLNVMGEEIIGRLGAAGYTVIVKLHDTSYDPQYIHSGGINWAQRLEPLLKQIGGHLATGSNACRYLVAADVLITDHSSVGFEYLLLDRPLIRIEMPELILKTNIPSDYVQLMASASTTVSDAVQIVAAVEQSLADPQRQSLQRKTVASELFHQPGTATVRAVRELYEVLELEAWTTQTSAA